MVIIAMNTLEDLKNYLPNLEKNGFFGVDDYNFESVSKAVQDFLKLYKPKFSELLNTISIS